MSDLVERLRKPVKHERREGFYTVTSYAPDPLRAEAASRISQQDAELERYRAAFSAIIERSHNDPLGTSKVVDMRRIAEQALEETLHG